MHIIYAINTMLVNDYLGFISIFTI